MKAVNVLLLFPMALFAILFLRPGYLANGQEECKLIWCHDPATVLHVEVEINRGRNTLTHGDAEEKEIRYCDRHHTEDEPLVNIILRFVVTLLQYLLAGLVILGVSGGIAGAGAAVLKKTLSLREIHDAILDEKAGNIAMGVLAFLGLIAYRVLMYERPTHYTDGVFEFILEPMAAVLLGGIPAAVLWIAALKVDGEDDKPPAWWKDPFVHVIVAILSVGMLASAVFMDSV